MVDTLKWVPHRFGSLIPPKNFVYVQVFGNLDSISDVLLQYAFTLQSV